MKYINVILILLTLLSVVGCSSTTTSSESKTSNDKYKNQHERINGRFDK